MADIILCIDAFFLIGYKSSSKYFSGQTNDTSVLSWIGQHGNLSLNDTFNYLLDPGIDHITLEATDGDLIANRSLTNRYDITDRILMPNGLCRVYEGKPVEAIHVKLFSKEPSEYFVFVSDPRAANPFQLPYSLLTGDSIKLVTTPTVKKFVDYNIKVRNQALKICIYDVLQDYDD